MPAGRMTAAKKTAAPSKTTVTKKTVVATPATRAKFTDMEKKKAAIKGGPGVKVAPKGTTMGTAQREAAKKKAEEFKGRHGSYPTPAFMKKNPGAR